MSRVENESDLPISVVLDTNIWVYDTKLLRSTLGSALLYAVYGKQVTIGLPEVVELEVLKHGTKVLQEAVDKIREGFSSIESLTGERDDYQVPEKTTLTEIVQKRLEELKEGLVRVPLTMQHARGALNRVMEETPPNGEHNQQFKDSAIWEGILELARCYKVVFVTQDKRFFRDQKVVNGLASNLAEDAMRVPGGVRVYSSLADMLTTIRDSVPELDKPRIEESLKKRLEERLGAEGTGAVIHGLADSVLEIFLTEQVNQLAVSFTLRYKVSYPGDHETQSSRTHEQLSSHTHLELQSSYKQGILEVVGDCMLSQSDYSISSMEVDAITIYDTDGQRKKSVQYLRVSDGLGRGRVRRKLRSPLSTYWR